MKIAYYCQHVLGVGHVHRSLEICRACADSHETTMILGGPELHLDEPSLTFFQLEPLMMDAEFSGLIPCNPARQLPQVKARRQEQLLHFISAYQPDRLVIELYPLGRKAFRFELEPLLELVVSSLPHCRISCSVRDILVEKQQGREKFENYAVKALNSSFHQLLVHGDPRIIELGETFEKLDQVTIPIHYTGYVTPPVDADGAAGLRATQVGELEKLIVASIGSGSVGVELLDGALAAHRLLPSHVNAHLQLFTGPHLPEEDYQRLASQETEQITISRFSPHFIDWLGGADASLSMAGYNTTINCLAAGVPSLLLPFSQNQEQRLRLEKLSSSGAITLLDPDDCNPGRLAELLTNALQQPRQTTRVDLDGARRSAELIAG